MKAIVKKSIKRALGKAGLDNIKHFRAEVLTKLDANIETEKNLAAEILAKLDTRDFRIDELKEKVTKVENYQPIYGVAGVVDIPARESRDRCDVIFDSLGDVSAARILDIGSSLGYVSFYFSDRGAHVDGWESNLQNAEVARLASEVNGIKANFLAKELNVETADMIPGNFYDTIIVLNVFHHIIRFQGLEATKKMVKVLLEKSPVMIVELAKKGEDESLPWNSSQPDDELEIFEGLDVKITKIGAFGNHLSENKRPLYKVESKKTVKVNERSYIYDSTSLVAYTKSPLRRMGAFRRKYYFAKDVIIKEYGLQSGIEKHFNIPEVHKEIAALSALSSLKENKKVEFSFPELLDAEVNTKHSRIVIAKAEGRLLSDLSPEILSTDEQQKEEIVTRVITDVLEQLSGLQQVGLFHNDVRAWNIIVGKEKCLLIDYGSASHVRMDDDLKGLLCAVAGFLSGAQQISGDSLPDLSDIEQSDTAKELYLLIKKGLRNPATILKEIKAASPKNKPGK
jgi:2-polyprenyl-3-methyl-5-hydroxy-6-metoxy-1,4-benzoquinol methylase/tRNA A-37 threonylcarbamoyl transferase component Bud32